MDKENMETASCHTGSYNVSKFVSRLSHTTFDTSCLLSNEMNMAKTIYARNVILVIFKQGG